MNVTHIHFLSFYSKLGIGLLVLVTDGLWFLSEPVALISAIPYMQCPPYLIAYLYSFPSRLFLRRSLSRGPIDPSAPDRSGGALKFPQWVRVSQTTKRISLSGKDISDNVLFLKYCDS